MVLPEIELFAVCGLGGRFALLNDKIAVLISVYFRRFRRQTARQTPVVGGELGGDQVSGKRVADNVMIDDDKG